MSSFEPFGIVLHAIPILIAGAELCRDGYGKGKLAFRKRKYVEKLARSLLLHQQTLLETIRLIITRSGYGYDEKVVLSGDSLAYFRDDDVQAQVEAFLGDDNYRALTGRVLDIQGILEEVAKHLDGLIPSHKDDPSDLIGIIEANQTAKKHKADIIPRLKVALKSDAIKQSISELDTATSTLHTFSQTVLMNRDGPFSSLVSSSNMRLAKAFRRIQSASKNLYTALCRCCTGTCHNEHNVHVFLEDRVDVASRLLRSTKQMSDEERAILAFQLIFAAKILAPIQTRCHELSVKYMQEDESDASPQELVPTLSRVRVSGQHRVEVKDSDPLRSKFVPIDNFCSAIVTAHEEAQRVAFILHASNRMGLITSKEQTVILKNNYQTISLREILSETSGAYGARLPLQSAMLLASKLASSLLQYAQTRWFGQAWSKDSISFLLHPESERKRSLADFDRPFVCAKIEDTDANGVNTAEPKSTLLELGILLLEIWHQTTLEHRFAGVTNQISSDYFTRLSLAAQWLDDDYNTLLPLYEQAVRYCVYGASMKRWTEWNTNELWGEICKEVIQPLSDNCGQWKGRPAACSK
ncbi:hypothetical protein BBK36DRAFT_1110097 [Trichoderma citrinoviride]|uniref:DUF7580 domain-containing protein n=1 Tax=Trichoderma citrinoviride TaxID=58853 RepID=A0A2T4BIZ8_9HYPO|nr:hypothetical protein BBK36DRAFT_1110097 [Trichoderma citrinoviride]PTB69280.1 hypothetical protein BBK36DRAFT_1110097 [Trichoderma citrinoviride]